MAGTSASLGRHFEGLVKRLVADGRYNNASEVVRDGLRMVEERERRLAALDAAVERSHADIQAGRTNPAEEVFDRLQAKYADMAKARGEL
ncbi:hypothetical UPF0156 family protein [Asticcacaulis biprosthecium C19]|uniref:Hypothetical UPF0156 family protein n=1 Tax=Asticcacaulis biprosthecium C19 TaxID=715226 RepID=F4QME9_9CAUL|nr:type II toxin-antitoxin system ParD family antitoxin [Asticcacaulis biprosthecium]EGF91390.1 hypothetical UPF0156 family protein [Asticcacaulis biprosthecium C19]